jgi:hypothetical protein
MYKKYYYQQSETVIDLIMVTYIISHNTVHGVKDLTYNMYLP